jgi:formate dehydrogenase subunit gamma
VRDGGKTYLNRFSKSERAVHWIHAAAFFVLLGSGLVLYLPSLAGIGNRGLVKDVHLYTAIAWALALLAVVLLGDRKGLRRTLNDLDGFDLDDRLWLRRYPTKQGRFNAGQKLNAAVTAAFAVLFAVSGILLWYGERDTRFRFAGTIVLHDGLMWISLVLLAGSIIRSGWRRSLPTVKAALARRKPGPPDWGRPSNEGARRKFRRGMATDQP